MILICTLQPIFILCFYFLCVSIKAILLSMIFMLGTEMKHLNKKNNRYVRIVATIVTLAIIAAASSMATAPAAATPATTGNATNTTSTTTTTTTTSQPELSPQPIYEERSPPGPVTPINETHGILTFSGNGMLTLPNTTQTINTTHEGTAVLSFTTSSGYGKETIRTENGETATATVYEIVQFNNPAALGGEGKGIVTAVFQTNSTGMLAPLNGTIAVGIDEISPTDESHTTLWKWESGIPLPTATTTTSDANATDFLSAQGGGAAAAVAE